MSSLTQAARNTVIAVGQAHSPWVEWNNSIATMALHWFLPACVVHLYGYVTADDCSYSCVATDALTCINLIALINSFILFLCLVQLFLPVQGNRRASILVRSFSFRKKVHQACCICMELIMFLFALWAKQLYFTAYSTHKGMPFCWL